MTFLVGGPRHLLQLSSSNKRLKSRRLERASHSCLVLSSYCCCYCIEIGWGIGPMSGHMDLTAFKGRKLIFRLGALASNSCGERLVDVRLQNGSTHELWRQAVEACLSPPRHAERFAVQERRDFLATPRGSFGSFGNKLQAECRYTTDARGGHSG